jgi:hypothetical protein
MKIASIVLSKYALKADLLSELSKLWEIPENVKKVWIEIHTEPKEPFRHLATLEETGFYIPECDYRLRAARDYLQKLRTHHS